MRWRAEVSRLMVPVAAPAVRRGELVLADLIGGQGGAARSARDAPDLERPNAHPDDSAHEIHVEHAARKLWISRRSLRWR